MKRRGNGEGSIFQRVDGRWCARMSLGRGPNGKRKIVSFYGRTRKKVAAKLADAQHDHARGILPDPVKETVEQYLTRWLRDTVAYSVRPTTAVSYGSILRKHAIPALGPIPLVKLTPGHIRELYGKMLMGGLSGAYVQRLHAILRRALSRAVKDGQLARNVLDVVDRPRSERKEMQVFGPEQVARLIEAAREDRLGAMVVLAATTGMRQGEVLGLRWASVDLAAGIVQVKQQLQWVGGLPLLLEPKTAAGRRPIELPALAVEILRGHRARQAEERLALGPGWRDAWGLVFTDNSGAPLTASRLLKHCYWPMLQRAGLPRLPFHALRHSHATCLLVSGTHPRVVQSRLGHATIGVTLDTYSHVLPGMGRTAADSIERLLAAEKRK